MASFWPGDFEPMGLVQVADPATEAAKCNLGLYLNCKGTGGTDCRLLLDSGDCKLTELIEQLFPHLPPFVNATAPVDVADNANVTTIIVNQTGPEANETRNATAPSHAHVLGRRQSSKCPEKCAAWAAIPPFGVWFGVCVADCKVRCKTGSGHCP